MAYNLLEEEWIPALYHDGRYARVGIRRAFADASRIRHVAASNPMDRVAIVRFLLALLYWCKGNPPPDVGAASDAAFPADWFSKLDESRGCFSLLSDGKRFYQSHAAQRHRAVTDLLQEIPTGNNFWHFRHSTDGSDGLCPACCAMGLLRLPLFSVSGLPDLKSGINGVPPVYVVPWGKSLLTTLRANWVTHEDLGEPAWVNPDIRPVPGRSVPLLSGLTLVSRRAWLHQPSALGPCIGCGAMEQALIRTCEFQTAGKQENELWDDPHVVYLGGKPRRAARAADLTAAGRFSMDRPWPDLLAHVLESRQSGLGLEAVSLLVVGFATRQAKNIDVWERTVELPPDEPTREAARSSVLRWQRECSGLPARLKRQRDQGAARKRKHVEVPAAIAAARPHVEGKVSSNLGVLLAGSDVAWAQAAREYGPMVDAIARALCPGFTASAVQQRKAIAAMIPNVGTGTKPTKKPRRKKGGDQ